MEYKIEVPAYNNGFIFNWDTGFKIEVSLDNDAVLISANKQGLISLARHLINLSQDDFKEGSHIQLDQYNSLEDNSKELIIQKLVV